MSDESQPSFVDMLTALLPHLAVAVVASVILTISLLRLAPAVAPAVSVSVVSFDIVKFTNAQRAVASTFLKPNADVSVPNELLLNLPERTRAAIREVAGPGALVVVKQAVVQGQTVDITDQVLSKLGLPLNVPTSDATAYALDVAPTNLFMPGIRPRSSEPAPVPPGPIALP